MPNVLYIPISGNKGKGLVSLIDEEDFDLVSVSKWYPLVRKHTTYAYHPRLKPFIYMHDLIVGVVGVDHKNGNGLDNRRCNLRPADQSRNMQNMRLRTGMSSQFKGVSWNKEKNKWEAAITIPVKRSKFLGRFETEIEAAMVYDAAAVQYFGEYARLNFPGGS